MNNSVLDDSFLYDLPHLSDQQLVGFLFYNSSIVNIKDVNDEINMRKINKNKLNYLLQNYNSSYPIKKELNISHLAKLGLSIIVCVFVIKSYFIGVVYLMPIVILVFSLFGLRTNKPKMLYYFWKRLQYYLIFVLLLSFVLLYLFN